MGDAAAVLSAPARGTSWKAGDDRCYAVSNPVSTLTTLTPISPTA